MKPLEQGKWIWYNKDAQPDEYGEFTDTFQTEKGRAEIRIACDSDYALWVNGTFVESNQYGDFEHYKIYDTVDLSPYLQEGDNRIAILVWYFGTDSQRYKAAPAGLLYEITDGEKLLAKSDRTTLARKSLAYQNGRKKKITGQLGYGFGYDASKEDRWICETTEGFVSAAAVEKRCTFFPRPIEKQQLGAPVNGKVIREEKTRYLIDVGKEAVGLLSFALTSETEQNLRIAYGEHLDEYGWVPRIIGTRDFSVEYGTVIGENQYFNPMLRLGCRYIEIQAEDPIEIGSVGIIPQYYPTKTIPAKLESALDQKIYDVCVNTLNLCMMEHYVDCPWREQNLYAFDSRNQMLCGYKVYEGGNFDYARANLKLFTEDRRDDGLLSICSPCGSDLTIPSFSLYYLLAMKEYTEASGDLTLAKESFLKMTEILNTFLSRRKNGLVCRLEGKQHWNFYDWSRYSDGTLGNTEEAVADAAINGLTVLALECLEKICKMTETVFPYPGIAEDLKTRIKETFFVPETGLITMKAGTEEYTDLGNTLAILTGVLTEREAAAACEKMQAGETVPCSLSMRTLKYDAMLMTDREKYYPLILDEIRRDYGRMLDAGADTFWETVKGAQDFSNAGSLCHGWSAVPVLYLPQIAE